MRQTIFLLFLSSTMVLAKDYILNERDKDLYGDITGYDTVTLSVPGSTFNGGAAMVQANKVLNITGNGNVNLTGSGPSEESKANTRGGSIYVGQGAQLNITQNTGLVNISDNHATATGGALSGLDDSSITVSNNGGGVTIANNVSNQYGGAIYSVEALTISNNGTKVSITDNACSTTDSDYKGGAISLRGQHGSFTIVGNDNVEFRGNYCQILNKNDKKTTEKLYLNSIWQEYTTQKNTISAKTGSTVTFYDAIDCTGNDSYLGDSYELNADYLNENNEKVEAKGEIIFSGEHAAEDLSEIKKKLKIDAQVEDLQASLTSNLLASTTLHNGTLSIQDGAILNTHEFTLKDGTGACLNLQNGELNTTEHSAIFGIDSLISAKGVNSITATTVTIGDDSVITLDLTDAKANSTVLTFNTSEGVQLGSHITLNIVGTDKLAAGNYNLLNLGDVDTSAITITGAASSGLSWNDGILSLAYIPEPATTTLSLLALTELVAHRRRRK